MLGLPASPAYALAVQFGRGHPAHRFPPRITNSAGTPSRSLAMLFQYSRVSPQTLHRPALFGVPFGVSITQWCEWSEGCAGPGLWWRLVREDMGAWTRAADIAASRLRWFWQAAEHVRRKCPLGDGLHGAEQTTHGGSSAGADMDFSQRATSAAVIFVGVRFTVSSPIVRALGARMMYVVREGASPRGPGTRLGNGRSGGAVSPGTAEGRILPHSTRR